MSTEMAVALAAETLEKVVVKGDLAALSAAERLLYYRTVCDSVGLNPLTRPFEYITLNGKLTLYARRDATDQLRSLHHVSISRLERETTEGVYCVTAYAVNAKDRTDSALGAVSIEGLKGEAKANAMMKAETKAKRRVTLSLCGLGMLDETETETIPGAVIGEPREVKTTVVEQKTDALPLGNTVTPDAEDAPMLLARIQAGFGKLALDQAARIKAWEKHCGDAELLSPQTDVAALGALLADLRGMAKAR